MSGLLLYPNRLFGVQTYSQYGFMVKYAMAIVVYFQTAPEMKWK